MKVRVGLGARRGIIWGMRVRDAYSCTGVRARAGENMVEEGTAPINLEVCILYMQMHVQLI